MQFAVDSIVDNIVLLENIVTKEKLYINITNLPNNIKEGTILNFKDNEYTIDKKTNNDRRKKIQEKLERLKKLKNN